MTPEEHIKGILGLMAIWLTWFIGILTEIKEGVSVLASLAAIVASIFYARYYWHKTRKEKRDSKYRENGKQ